MTGLLFSDCPAAGERDSSRVRARLDCLLTCGAIRFVRIQYVRRAAKDANSSRFSLCGECGSAASVAAPASLSLHRAAARVVERARALQHAMTGVKSVAVAIR